jgi:putative ABC transport system permease protein
MQDFAYKITIGFGVFCLAGVIALVVAFISIGFVAMKAALANPVDAVRYE